MANNVRIYVSQPEVFVTGADPSATTVQVVVGGTVGPAGSSGYSGYSGAGGSGASGYSGFSGQDGAFAGSGYSGFSGPSGYSGFSGPSGYSGFTGTSGYSGFSGASGYSGFSGSSGYSGYSGTSGYSGFSAYSGYSGIGTVVPINSQSTNYPTVLTDAGKAILHPSSDNNPRTFTIDGSLAYPTGTVLTFINQINTLTLAISTDTMTLYPSGDTGSRTIAAMNVVTAVKVASGEWILTATSGVT